MVLELIEMKLLQCFLVPFILKESTRYNMGRTSKSTIARVEKNPASAGSTKAKAKKPMNPVKVPSTDVVITTALVGNITDAIVTIEACKQ